MQLHELVGGLDTLQRKEFTPTMPFAIAVAVWDFLSFFIAYSKGLLLYLAL